MLISCHFLCVSLCQPVGLVSVLRASVVPFFPCSHLLSPLIAPSASCRTAAIPFVLRRFVLLGRSVLGSVLGRIAFSLLFHAFGSVGHPCAVGSPPWFLAIESGRLLFVFYFLLDARVSGLGGLFALFSVPFGLLP